jgi:hypothetical protein
MHLVEHRADYDTEQKALQAAIDAGFVPKPEEESPAEPAPIG